MLWKWKRRLRLSNYHMKVLTAKLTPSLGQDHGEPILEVEKLGSTSPLAVCSPQRARLAADT